VADTTGDEPGDPLASRGRGAVVGAEAVRPPLSGAGREELLPHALTATAAAATTIPANSAFRCT
jgi:hypothetical protein